MFNFDTTTREVLNAWNVTDEDIEVLCQVGFTDLIKRNLAHYRAIDSERLQRELNSVTVSPYAWVYRTLLAASFEVPHIRNLCMPQADGASFVDKLCIVNGASERRFAEALESMIGPATVFIHRTMNSDHCTIGGSCAPADMSVMESYQEYMRTLGCEDNFVKLADIVCTANPRTEYGADRHLLDIQLSTLQGIECAYTQGTLDGKTFEEAMQKIGVYYACNGVGECQKLRRQLSNNFNQKYVQNGVLTWQANGRLNIIDACGDARYVKIYAPVMV